jgi:tetratricopeptide (TPR) repeat protein
VEAVAAEPDDADVIELLESLADKSLLRLVEDSDEPRIAMFETIRDYARERLAKSHDALDIRRRYADFFLTLAETAEPRLTGREQSTWLARLDRDQANLRAAIAWFREQEACERALRLGSALWRFWWLRGDLGEGRVLLQDLLKEVGDCDQALRAKALNGAGVLAESHGDLDLAAQLHEESLQISRRLGDLRGTAWALNNLGVVEINRGNFDRANTLLEESLAVAEETNDAAMIATDLIDLEQIAHHQGDPERSIALLTRALSLFRALDDESQMARALNNLAMVAFERGENEHAHELLSESLALHRSVGDRQGIASTLNNLAEVLTAIGDYDNAIGLLLESQMLATEAGNRLYAAIASENLANLTRKKAESRGAATQYREALLLYRAVADQQGILSCLAGLALVAADEGDAHQAVALLGAVSALHNANEDLEFPDVEATVLELRAALGDQLFDSIWHAGATLPCDEIIEWVAVRALPLRLPAAA